MKTMYTSLIVLALLLPNAAFAHAHLKVSSPAKDSVVHKAPEKVTADFTEDVEIAMSKLEVKNAKTGEVVSNGAPTYVGDKKNSIEVKMKTLKAEKQTLQVTWKAVTKDTHKMSDTYSFTFDPKPE
jgi:methionine-rich copper-binding protein CopC